MNTKWNVWNYSLETFTGIHSNYYVQLQDSEEHLHFQLTTKHNRVGHLLDNIHNNDPALCAAISGVYINMNVMRNNVNFAVAFLFPVDPYDKNCSENNPCKSQTLEINLKGRGHINTGVDLRQQTKSEYYHLNTDQCKELYERKCTKNGK